MNCTDLWPSLRPVARTHLVDFSVRSFTGHLALDVFTLSGVAKVLSATGSALTNVDCC